MKLRQGRLKDSAVWKRVFAHKHRQPVLSGGLSCEDLGIWSFYCKAAREDVMNGCQETEGESQQKKWRFFRWNLGVATQFQIQIRWYADRSGRCLIVEWVQLLWMELQRCIRRALVFSEIGSVPRRTGSWQMNLIPDSTRSYSEGTECFSLLKRRFSRVRVGTGPRAEQNSNVHEREKMDLKH